MATKKKSSSTVGPIGFTPYKLKKGEKYMSEAQFDHFRNILRLWKQQLMEEVDHTIDHMREASIHSDPLDRAAQEEGFALELRNRNREGMLIKKIEYSLERIDRGDYGYCESCGAEIGIRRLEARPTAELCIDCKTFDEIREKQTSG
jgi:DnaK suppressor protein